MTKHDTISEARAAAKPQPETLPRSAVPFPAAGPDAFFFFALGSQERLEDALDAIAPVGEHETYFGRAERLLLAGNLAAVRAAVDCGLKKLEGGKLVPFADVDLDEISWTVSEIVETALDALARGHLGKPYKQLIEEMTAAREAAIEEERRAWREKHGEAKGGAS